jgi:DNA-binding transcriptional regulator LsrR (DeoR family)
LSAKAETEALKFDDAARVGWLYFIAGKTQAQIAAELATSRQTVQRLVALAVSENLIKMRLDYPIARCMELAQALQQTFGLTYCDVTPSVPGSESATLGISNAAAAKLETVLADPSPKVVAMGTGEEMRATANQLRQMVCPHHKLVSLVGNISADGSATLLDAVSRAAEAVRAPHYPMPCSVLVPTKAERDAIIKMRHVRQVIELGRAADVTFVGIGSMALDAPLVRDGFMTPSEMRAMMALGSVGEITGWAYDQDGVLIKGLANDRVVGQPPGASPKGLVVGVSMAPDRQQAIRAALKGRLINGLITNDLMAERLLQRS